MRRLNLTLALILSFFISTQLGASTNDMSKIEEVELSKGSEGGETLVASFSGKALGTPELTVKDQMVQIAVRNSYVWPKIEKKVTISEKFDTTLMAYQFEKDVVRIRAMLPYSLKGKEDQVSLILRDGKIELNIPKVKVAPRKVVKAPKKEKKQNNYDEGYLQQLLDEKTETSDDDFLSDFDNGESQEQNEAQQEDEVSVAMSAPDKGESSSAQAFSIGSYIGKFVAFLALVLLLFYGMVSLMKKGVFKKSRLGFLNSTKMVEVLNTTYIAPKRSLMMVKAHNQVFLIGSSETGLNLISEVNDVTGLLKDGEKKLAGDNFDTSLNYADEQPKEFKLKDMETYSQGGQKSARPQQSQMNTESSLEGLLDDKRGVKDSVKLSDQIKDKVKGLKSLQ